MARPAQRRWWTAAAAVVVLSAVAEASPPVVSFAARAVQPGELVVATIQTAAPVNRVTVRAFDHDVAVYRVDDRTWNALIGIDLDVKAGAHPVSIDTGGAAGERVVRQLVVRPKRFPTRQLRVDEAFVNPPASADAEIADDARTLAALWTASDATRLWTGPFVRPVPQAANSAFGTRSVFNGEPRAPHGGADFLSPAGTPIAAPNAGRVVLATKLYYTGNTVVIDHGLGLFSLFAHLSVTEVQTGEMVSAGQILGKVGATGRVTGPHLHWMTRLNGARVDPLSVLAELGRTGSAR